jgi:hypothetical protein
MSPLALTFILTGLALLCLPYLARDLRWFIRYRRIRQSQKLALDIAAHNCRVWERRQARQISEQAAKRALRSLRKKGVI